MAFTVAKLNFADAVKVLWVYKCDISVNSECLLLPRPIHRNSSVKKKLLLRCLNQFKQNCIRWRPSSFSCVVFNCAKVSSRLHTIYYPPKCRTGKHLKSFFHTTCQPTTEFKMFIFMYQSNPILSPVNTTIVIISQTKPEHVIIWENGTTCDDETTEEKGWKHETLIISKTGK